MNDSQDQDDLICVKEACRLFVKPVPRTTLGGWVSNGVLNKFTKERIYLALPTQHGGLSLFSRAAISLFIKRLNSRVPTNEDGTPKEEQP